MVLKDLQRAFFRDATGFSARTTELISFAQEIVLRLERIRGSLSDLHKFEPYDKSRGFLQQQNGVVARLLEQVTPKRARLKKSHHERLELLKGFEQRIADLRVAVLDWLWTLKSIKSKWGEFDLDVEEDHNQPVKTIEYPWEVFAVAVRDATDALQKKLAKAKWDRHNPFLRRWENKSSGSEVKRRL